MTTVKNLAASVAEAIADGDSALGKEIDVLAARVVDLAHRLDLVEASNATLRTANEAFGRELSLLARLDRESAPAKPKAKRKSADAQGLPDFVRTTAPPKRKPRGAMTIEAPASAEGAA